MKKTLAVLILIVLVLLVACTPREPAANDVADGTSDTLGGVSTPLDTSLEQSEAQEDDFNLEELDALDEDLNSLEGDLAAL